MTDEQEQLRIIFPASTGLGVLVLPLAEVTADKRYERTDGIITQGARVNGWSMERTLDAAGRTLPNEEDDGNPVYVREALIAWLSWHAWLQRQPTADDREQDATTERSV